MSDSLKHECGVAMLRLLKPLEFYKEKYGTSFYGLKKMYTRAYNCQCYITGDTKAFTVRSLKLGYLIPICILLSCRQH